jgi:antitoxin (DNA-binding transcriptional repressor) of toxin-antitoxin stability system
MVNNMTMKKVNVFEIKARLSEYLDLVEKGEQVVICRRNRPIAELRAIGAARSTDRPLGGTSLEVPATFFDPLPSEFEDAFSGEPAAGRHTSKVAEHQPTDGAPTPTKPRKKT